MQNDSKLSKAICGINDNKQLIYPVFLYIAGLIIGAAIFKFSKDGVVSQIFKQTINVDTDSFTSLFFNRFSIYISIFVVTIFLGMCIIGYPFIYAVPALTGIIIAFKIAYFYFNYKVKGIGYSLLLIIPESAALETVLILTIEKAASLSRYIFNEALNKTDMTEEINLKSYLKSFLIFFVCTAAIALVNALLTYLLGSLISL